MKSTVFCKDRRSPELFFCWRRFWPKTLPEVIVDGAQLEYMINCLFFTTGAEGSVSLAYSEEMLSEATVSSSESEDCRLSTAVESMYVILGWIVAVGFSPVLKELLTKYCPNFPVRRRDLWLLHSTALLGKTISFVIT